MIAAIFFATGSPPTGHAPTSASPAAIAFASASQPAYPHPPQLLPGSSALTSISFWSTSTANFLPMNPRKRPRIKPTMLTTAAAIIIPVIFISSL